MDSDGDTNWQRYLAPLDWENQPEAPQDTNLDSSPPPENFLKLLEIPNVMSMILSRLPLKSLGIFKCVSKKVMSEIKLVEQFMDTRGAITGFFAQGLYNEDDSLKPIDVDKIRFIDPRMDPDTVPDPSLSFIKHNTSESVMLLDSCDGLLLLCILNTKSFTNFLVCNPLTKEVVTIPQCCQQFTLADYFYLIADLDESGYLKYRVVLFFIKKGEIAGNLLTFSSVTGEWEEIKTNFPPMQHPDMIKYRVYFKGSIFWDCFEKYILVCHLDEKSRNNNVYELIEAPYAPLGRCLWVYNDKLLCYCHGYKGEYPAWSLSVYKNNEFKWKKEGCNKFKTMAGDIASSRTFLHLRPKSKSSLPQVNFQIEAYDAELDTVYFWDYYSDYVSSYRLDEREVRQVFEMFKYNWWICYSTDVFFVYRHSFAPIQTCAKGKLGEKVKRENENLDTLENDGELVSSTNKKYCEKKLKKVKPRRRKAKNDLNSLEVEENVTRESEAGLEKTITNDKEDVETIEKDDGLASTDKNGCANKVKVKSMRRKAKKESNKEREGKLEKKVRKKNENLESIEKEDELVSTDDNCRVNKVKVKSRPRRAKFDFNMLQLEEE